MQDYSYIGFGPIVIREYGSAAAYEEIGNCSSCTMMPKEDIKQLKNYRVQGGGLQNEVRRISGVDMGYTFHDYSAENFARGLRADVVVVAAASNTDELAVAYKGGYTPLAKIANAISVVEPAGGGTAFTVGTDYELRDGQLYIPSTSTITNPVSGAANVQVTYTNLAQKRIEALTNPNKFYQVMFLGLNEAQSGKRVRIRAHKVSGGVLKQMSLIGEEYGAGDIEGGLVRDSTIVGEDLSKYFIVEFED